MDSSSATAATVAPVVTSAPPLEDCLRLLRGERDEQKLAGLLVAANVCRAGDADAVANVYRAVGPRFLRRLLNTGLGKVEGGKEEEREAYMRLAVTVLAGLARVPEVAADEGVVSTVPLVAEVVAKSTDPAITEECFELLSLIAIASEDGAYEFCEPGVIDMIFLQILSLTDGSKCVELAINLLQLLVHKLKVDTMSSEKLQGMTRMVTCLARIFAVLHTAVKFDALHMLTFLLSQKESGEGLFCSPPMAQNSQSTSCAEWAVAVVFGSTLPKSHGAECFQIGVSSEKLHALLLAECMMSILGEDWLSEDFEVQDNQNVLSVDKFVLLVLESARVEVAVLLNELAYLKYESSKISQTDEAISQKQRNLAILFSLIERIIKMISNASSGEGIFPFSCLLLFHGHQIRKLRMKMWQDHGQWKGDDLLAAARIVGSYLAEAPYACKEKTGNLLEFIFSIEGQDESSSFYSICFMLPMLSQITMEVDGCRTLASFGGHKAVIDCLVKMTEQGGMTIDNGSMFLACDTIINFMSNMKSVHIPVDYCFIRLLKALVTWAGTTDASSVTMTASCLCVMLLDMTSEKFLLSCSHFDANILGSLSEIIIRSLQQDIPDDDSEQFKQKQIIVSGYKRWADRFPRVKDVVEQHVSV
ncbi:neurochondrin family protein [Zea mays]|uniref:Neurochondrin family protein n=1 Tax=Zea mays TaxID=4577 RepID=A0A1D6HNH3_MAIZE|nr:neurochondrin family protein [Zea mays]